MAERIELLMPGADGRIAKGPLLENRGREIQWAEPVAYVHPSPEDEIAEWTTVFTNRAFLCVFVWRLDGAAPTREMFYVPEWLTDPQRGPHAPSAYAEQLVNERLRRRLQA